jgi:hypothetical protein
VLSNDVAISSVGRRRLYLDLKGNIYKFSQGIIMCVHF